jgi:short subunit fatty acids transporter
VGNNLACSTYCNHRLAATSHTHTHTHTHTHLRDLVPFRYIIVNTLMKVIILIIITVIIIIKTLVFQDTNVVKREDEKSLKYKYLTI